MFWGVRQESAIKKLFLPSNILVKLFEIKKEIGGGG